MEIPHCFSGDGHDWINVTTVGEHAMGLRKWLCSRCDTMITVDERERLRRGQHTGYETVVN